MGLDYPHVPPCSLSLVYLLLIIMTAGLLNQMSNRFNPMSRPPSLCNMEEVKYSDDKDFSRSFQLLPKSVMTDLGVTQKLRYWHEEEAAWSGFNL